jgi:hypothetical protein
VHRLRSLLVSSFLSHLVLYPARFEASFASMVAVVARQQSLAWRKTLRIALTLRGSAAQMAQVY